MTSNFQPDRDQPSRSHRNLVSTAIIRKGQTDSCVAVSQASGEKCYGLPADAARIFSVCGDGDSCSITGQWDDKAETLTSSSVALGSSSHSSGRPAALDGRLAKLLAA